MCMSKINHYSTCDKLFSHLNLHLPHLLWDTTVALPPGIRTLKENSSTAFIKSTKAWCQRILRSIWYITRCCDGERLELSLYSLQCVKYFTGHSFQGHQRDFQEGKKINAKTDFISFYLISRCYTFNVLILWDVWFM